jgi:peptidoglycan/xylan/chitin deacetylase (PgdA/CDA1 family)
LTPDTTPFAAPRRAVVNFHGIGTPGRALEPGEARFWIGEARFAELLDRIAALPPAARPLITFDDGNASDAAIAAPALAARGLRATFFVLAGRLGRPGSLAAGDVAALAAAGHGIGLHGADHVDWRALDAAGQAHEFDAARAAIAAAAGRPVTEAAAPFGLYDRRVVAGLRARGLVALYTSDKGRADLRGFVRARTCITADMDAAAEAGAIAGHVPPARRLRRLAGIARKRLFPLGAG